MKTIIEFEIDDDAEEDAIEIRLKSGETFDEYLTFLQEAIKVNIQSDENENFCLTSESIELDLTLLHSLMEMIGDKYMDIIHQPAILDMNMKPIPRPRKGGKVHKLQRPTPAEEFKEE